VPRECKDSCSFYSFNSNRDSHEVLLLSALNWVFKFEVVSPIYKSCHLKPKSQSKQRPRSSVGNFPGGVKLTLCSASSCANQDDESRFWKSPIWLHYSDPGTIYGKILQYVNCIRRICVFHVIQCVASEQRPKALI
jgi:hypothetical protein